MPLAQEQYNHFVDSLENILNGVAIISSRNYNPRTSSGMDLVMRPEPDSTSIADMIQKAFEPAAWSTRTKYWTIIEFKVQDVDPSHPILTQAGMEAAHHKMFDQFKTYVIDERGRLGKCLDSVSEELGKTKDEIRDIISTKIDELKTKFENGTSYAEKNSVFPEMRTLYQDIRNHEKLSSIVQDNSPRHRP